MMVGAYLGGSQMTTSCDLGGASCRKAITSALVKLHVASSPLSAALRVASSTAPALESTPTQLAAPARAAPSEKPPP